MSFKILIIDQVHESLLPTLGNLGLVVDYAPNLSRDEIKRVLFNYQGIIVRSKTWIDEDLLKHAPLLKIVARAGAGVDLIDLAVLEKRNIVLINAPEGNRDAVAEHTIGMLLCLMNNIHLADQQVRKGIWDREGNRGIELKDKVVGLIGYGNIGREVAKRLNAFGVHVLAYDKYLKNYQDAYVQEATMDEIFSKAHVLSLHIPLTSETKGLVNKAYLQSFTHSIYLINTARGEIVQLKALKNALEQGKVLGCCLDVLENEKINKLAENELELFHYFTNSSKVILTPHIAGWTKESYIKINQVLVQKLSLFLDKNRN